jgi:parallel beta-helix repeat protein
MNSQSRAALVGLTTLGVSAALLVAAGPASASTHNGIHKASRTVYVAPTEGKHRVNGNSCAHPDFTSIQTAIEKVALGGTVIVCKGTYPGLVNVDRRVTLSGRPGATIDATGMPYGVGVSASWSTVTGLKVMNASPLDPENGLLADGIVTIALGATGPVAADHVRIVHNEVTGNLGSGIDINSSSYSTASFNYAHDNGVGVNVANDIGRPANHNTISFNVANKNFGGCGIALADHTGVGVSYNTVAHNIADDNGLSTPTAPEASAGSGVILASPVPAGIVKGNVIIGNEFSGNGHGGVVMHAHAPGADFSGNSILFNRIGKNNLRTDENDLKTTGIYLGSLSPQKVKVSGNIIGPDYYGIFTSGPVTVTGGKNLYVRVTHKRGSAATF